MSDELVVHPEVIALQEQITAITKRLAVLLEEREHLLHHVAPSLEMAYMEQLGQFEYRLYEIEVAIARAKRKAEMIQAGLNRGVAVALEDVELALDQEQAEYVRKLEEMAIEYRRMKHWQEAGALNEKEALELKTWYRQLVKWLHPDVNVDLSEQERNLWQRIQDAYKDNNHELLSVLYEIATQLRSQQGNTHTSEKMHILGLAVDDVLASLRARREFLDERVKLLVQQLNELHERHPFTLKSLLENRQELKAKQHRLLESIAQAEQVFVECEAYVTILIAQMSSGSR